MKRPNLNHLSGKVVFVLFSVKLPERVTYDTYGYK